MTEAPIILWFRQDLRLADNPALRLACDSGRPVVLLYVLADAADGRPWGGASRWWLELSLRALDLSLGALGARLVLRRGDPVSVVEAMAREVGATDVVWNRVYGGAAQARDAALMARLTENGVRARSCNASLLLEPWALRTGAGGAYKVFTPFWRAARAAIGAPEVLGAPTRIAALERPPASDRLEDWTLYPAAPDWAAGFGDWIPGEVGARARLDAFLQGGFGRYAAQRDEPGIEASSRLSPHLHWGEIGPRQVWAAAHAASAAGLASERDLDKLLSELGWREFNHHLLAERPDLKDAAFKPAYEAMPWRSDPQGLAAWRRGRTGYPLVDAGMRQLWTTGWMHNRVRLVAASFLVKHLLIDWREGERWFWDTLVDADEANNPANWQWVAGCGADASPFFRIFNPVAQGERFDPKGDYVRRWVPELAGLPDSLIHQPWKGTAAERNRAGMEPGDYPAPVVEHAQARLRALDAFKNLTPPSTDSL